MSETDVNAGFVAPGEYAPAGEAPGDAVTFGAEQVATAFAVTTDRVHRAMSGELALGPNAQIDSRQAQRLAEVLLGNLPLAGQQAALMRLGAFTPRADHEWGIGEAAPGEESDRVIPASPAEARARHRRAHDPARTTG